LNTDNKLYNTNRNKLVFAAGEVDTSTSNSSYPDPDKEDNNKVEKYIINTIELRVYQNNLLVAARIVKKRAKKAQVFKQGWVVILAILKKLQLSIKPKYLPVQIVSINKQLYILISRFGYIKGTFQAGQLNSVESNILGLDIAIDWPDTGPKILLTQAVQLFNNCSTLVSVQKANCNIQADQAKANKYIVEALNFVVFWVAKLQAPEPAPGPILGLAPEPASVSLAPELEVLYC
jgi:hypothetical protein